MKPDHSKTRLAIRATTPASRSSTLLVLGGLALLVLAVSDASFLALSVRFLRGTER